MQSELIVASPLLPRIPGRRDRTVKRPWCPGAFTGRASTDAGRDLADAELRRTRFRQGSSANPLSSIQTEREDRRAGCDRDVLLAVDGVGHRPGLPSLAGVELPERLSILRIGGDESASAVAIEQQPAGRRHQTASQNPTANRRHFPSGL